MLNALRTDNSPFTEPQLKQLKASIGLLDAAQAQWLSGYLAGQLVGNGQATAFPAPLTETQPILSVFYGSETGHGESIASKLVEALNTKGIRAELVSLDGYRPASLKKLEHAVFVVSTHGEGDPPEPALDMFEFLESDRAPQLPKLNYRVLALGDLSYSQFCAAGRRLDARLEALGANRFGERVECDLDYAAQVSAWSGEIVNFAQQHLQPAANKTVAAPTLSVVPATPRWTREHPYTASILRQQQITGKGSQKDVWHLELALGDSGITYQPGDALGIWAPNPPELVAEVLQNLAISPDAPVEIDGRALPITTALEQHRELTRLSHRTALAWAELTGQKALSSLLEQQDAVAQKQFVETRQFPDLLKEWPGTLEPQSLADLLRPLTPRSYSIASSQAIAEDEVHLTVASLTSNAIGVDRFGLASQLLNHRLAEGDTLRVFPESNPRFRLPQDADIPIIMIGAGTGIAPYRAFMQQREEQGSTAPAWLIFGNPHLRTDFLYQREWLQWRERGQLTRIDTAFSRDQGEKCYVQHVVAEQAARINSWLDRGALIYLCGGLDMGQSVQQALRDILVRERGVTLAAAELELAKLRRQKRLLKDLY